MKKLIPDVTRFEPDIKVDSIYSEYEEMTDEELIEKAEEIINRYRTRIANVKSIR